MSLELWLSLAGLSISAAAATAIVLDARKPGRRPAYLALVFAEAAAFFLGVVAGRLGGSAFAAEAFSYCGTLVGLPSLYLFEREAAGKVGGRALRHYAPALANLPLGLAMAYVASRGGSPVVALYYGALIAAQTAQLFIYGRASLALARSSGRAPGGDWPLRTARAVIAAYAVVTAMSWAVVLAALAEEILGRELGRFSWIDPVAVLAALFLAWTLGLCALWGGDRASPEGREMRKYGGRPLPPAEAAALAGRLRALLAAERDLASEAVQPRELARRLDLPYHLLSRAVNEGLGMSVLELVNEYRVERAKAVLASESGSSVLDACFEAGFQSKSTFNEVFRKKVGMTPREYRASLASRPASGPSAT